MLVLKRNNQQYMAQYTIIVKLKFIVATKHVVKTSCFRNRSLTFFFNLPTDFDVN